MFGHVYVFLVLQKQKQLFFISALIRNCLFVGIEYFLIFCGLGGGEGYNVWEGT